MEPSRRKPGRGAGIASLVCAILGHILLAGAYITSSPWPSGPWTIDWSGPHIVDAILFTGAALILGHISLSRSKRSVPALKRKFPVSDGLALGYLWFGVALFLSEYKAAVPALLGLVEGPLVFLGQYRKRPWVAFAAGCVLAGSTWVLLVSGREALFVFGLVGVVLTVLLPGVILFARPSPAHRGSRALIGGTLYLVAILCVFGLWRGYGIFRHRAWMKAGWGTVRIQRELSMNLETYYIDHNSYPPAVDAQGKIVPLDSEDGGVSAGYVPWLLTTPIAYRSDIPLDPYSSMRREDLVPFRYATNGEFCWIMASNGKDGDIDVKVADYPDPKKGNCEWKRFLSHFGIGDAIEYDGTNGTASNGDILRRGP